MSVADNLLCTHCGKSGHLKERCDKLKEANERYVKFVKSYNCQTNREQGCRSCDVSVSHDKPVKKLKEDMVLVTILIEHFHRLGLEDFFVSLLIESHMKWVTKTSK